MENVVNEYNVTWYDRESHENFTATFGSFNGAKEHANFIKTNNLGDDVFVTEVQKHMKVLPESEWLDS